MIRIIICNAIACALSLAAIIISVLFFVSLPKKIVSVVVPEEYEGDAAELFKYNKFVGFIGSYTSMTELFMIAIGLVCVFNGSKIFDRIASYGEFLYPILLLTIAFLAVICSVICKIYLNKAKIKFCSGIGEPKSELTRVSVRLGISYAAIIFFTGYAVATLCLL